MLCGIVFAAASLLSGNVYAQGSPKQTATAVIGGKNITIAYSAPSVKGRKIFGNGGLVAKDPQAPIWRAGANQATALTTDGDMMIGDVAVPAGKYTLFVDLKDSENWTLIISKETGQWGLAYKPANDLGRVKMKMSKPATPVEQLKYSISAAASKGIIQLEWENHVASVPVSVK